MRFLAVWVNDIGGHAIAGAFVRLNEFIGTTNTDGWVGLSISPDLVNGQLTVTAPSYKELSRSIALKPTTRDISIGPVPQTSQDPIFLPGLERLLGDLYPMRGATAFRLPHRREFMGEFDNAWAVLRELRGYGVNIIRELWMKTNNTGWELRPSDWPDFFDRVRFHYDWLRDNSMRSLSCVFADTRQQMADAGMQHEHWLKFVEVAKEYQDIVILQLVNEADNHQWSNLDPSAFAKPVGILSCHGTNGTDANPPSPRWDVASYGVRRVQHEPTDARPITNCNPYEFQAVYPQPCPLIGVETWKAGEHFTDPAIAELMRKHGDLGWGLFYHTNAGIDARPFNPVEAACAGAFFKV
jgi:hypothetical protein